MLDPLTWVGTDLVNQWICFFHKKFWTLIMNHYSGSIQISLSTSSYIQLAIELYVTHILPL